MNKGRKARIGCLGVITYCVIMLLVMHFALGEGFFGAVGAHSTMHGGNPDYREWHGQVLDDVTAPVQLPLLIAIALFFWLFCGISVLMIWK